MAFCDLVEKINNIIANSSPKKKAKEDKNEVTLFEMLFHKQYEDTNDYRVNHGTSRLTSKIFIRWRTKALENRIE